MKIGYTRISKQEQNEALQRDALQDAECEKYFSDTMTGAKFERKGLEKLLAFMRTGDTVVVWKLDRLGRSLKDLIETLNLLKERGVDFISLTEKIDTTTPGGKLIFHLMGALAEFERDLIPFPEGSERRWECLSKRFRRCFPLYHYILRWPFKRFHRLIIDFRSYPSPTSEYRRDHHPTKCR